MTLVDVFGHTSIICLNLCSWLCCSIHIIIAISWHFSQEHVELASQSCRAFIKGILLPVPLKMQHACSYSFNLILLITCMAYAYIQYMIGVTFLFLVLSIQFPPKLYLCRIHTFFCHIHFHACHVAIDIKAVSRVKWDAERRAKSCPWHVQTNGARAIGQLFNNGVRLSPAMGVPSSCCSCQNHFKCPPPTPPFSPSNSPQLPLPLETGSFRIGSSTIMRLRLSHERE